MRHSIARPAYQAIVLLVVVVPLLATGLAVLLLWQRAVRWPDLVLLAVMYTFVAVGVTVGYHRMLTHRSFVPHPAVKFVLLVLGSMALEGDAIQWTATHTKHHALADRPGDPHSPLDGFFHAHLGWIFVDPDADPRRFCRHLLRDRLVVFVSRTHLLWVVLAMAIPFAIGGVLGGWAGALTGLLWGGLVRQFLTHHVTWSVNSVCHTFGKRAFDTNDASRNEWIVGLLVSARVGTTTTMRSRVRRFTACAGGNLTSPATSSGCSSGSDWRTMCTASRQRCSRGDQSQVDVATWRAGQSSGSGIHSPHRRWRSRSSHERTLGRCPYRLDREHADNHAGHVILCLQT